MEFVIITGMSGAGKSLAVNTFEDMGYFCVDNMPPVLLSEFLKVCRENAENITKVALVIDVRSVSFQSEFSDAVKNLEESFGKCKVLFLDASDNELVKRYKETRRKHPLSSGISLTQAFEKEREILDPILKSATYVLNTSDMTPGQLKNYIKTVVDSKTDRSARMSVEIVSFGFKYGIVLDADNVFDVRFLPNPYYIEHLRAKTGLDDEVSEMVKSSPDTKEYIKHLSNLINFTLPLCEKEGKTSFVVAIGCTGGKHRSVTVANELYHALLDSGYNVYLTHRDINKDR